MQSIPILVATAFAAAVLASGGATVSAHAQQKGAKPQRPQVIIIDRSLGRPPPPHERNYVGPPPSIAPPMQRIPQVPPLAQPPIPR